MGDALSQTPGRSLQHRRDELSSVPGGDQVAQRARTIQLAIRYQRLFAAFRAESIAKVMQVVQTIKDQPRPEALLFADQLPRVRDPPPKGGAAVDVSPDRDNSRRGIPTPNPFVLAPRHGKSYCAIISPL